MPELLTGPGSALRPAYRMRPRSCFTLFLSRTSTGASTTSTSGLIRCSRRRRGAKVWVLTGPRPLMRFGDPVERAPSGPSSPCASPCCRLPGGMTRLIASELRCSGGVATAAATGWATHKTRTNTLPVITGPWDCSPEPVSQERSPNFKGND